MILSEPPLATLFELKTMYDISDLYDFHEMLDMKDELAVIGKEEMDAAKKAQQDNNKGR